MSSPSVEGKTNMIIKDGNYNPYAEFYNKDTDINFSFGGDVTTYVVDDSIKAHRIVLSSHSSKFEQIINVIANHEKMKQADITIDIPHDKQIFEILIKYFYTHQIECTITDLIKLTKLIDFYDVKNLKPKIETYVLNSLNETNIIDCMTASNGLYIQDKIYPLFYKMSVNNNTIIKKISYDYAHMILITMSSHIQTDSKVINKRVALIDWILNWRKLYMNENPFTHEEAVNLNHLIRQLLETIGVDINKMKAAELKDKILDTGLYEKSKIISLILDKLDNEKYAGKKINYIDTGNNIVDAVVLDVKYYLNIIPKTERRNYDRIISDSDHDKSISKQNF